jgi:hypothetical protein
MILSPGASPVSRIRFPSASASSTMLDRFGMELSVNSAELWIHLSASFLASSRSLIP